MNERNSFANPSAHCELGFLLAAANVLFLIISAPEISE
jgi:hypothetical protein